MSEWISGIDPATAGGWFAAIAAVAVLLRWVIPPLRRLGHLMDDLAGEPARPGQPRRPGLMERLAALEERTELVERRTRELQHNGGASIKDQIARVDQALTDQREA